MAFDIKTDTGGKRWVEAPPPYGMYTSDTSAITGVWLYPNQEVEWIWSHSLDSSRITGYTIRDRIGETP